VSNDNNAKVHCGALDRLGAFTKRKAYIRTDVSRSKWRARQNSNLRPMDWQIAGRIIFTGFTDAGMRILIARIEPYPHPFSTFANVSGKVEYVDNLQPEGEEPTIEGGADVRFYSTPRNPERTALVPKNGEPCQRPTPGAGLLATPQVIPPQSYCVLIGLSCSGVHPLHSTLRYTADGQGLLHYRVLAPLMSPSGRITADHRGGAA
jgi:hypothetical protein